MKIINNIHQFAQGILPPPSELGIPQVDASNDKLQTILLFVFGLLAAISFLMIVFGGFRYVISIGDPSKIATARKTITYAIVGLIIALSAMAIVAFVIGNIA